MTYAVEDKILLTSKGWKMKVDMSPKAVTARLELLNQLWELSVKLQRVRRGSEPNTEITDTGPMSNVPSPKSTSANPSSTTTL